LAKSATKQATSHVGDLLDRIGEAHKAGKPKKAIYETKRYLQSFDARYLACVAAYKGLRPPRRPPISQLPAIAERLNAWTSSTEPVILYLKEKEPLPLNQGEMRIVLDFGFENRALQQLVLPALKAQADDLIHPNQYPMRGTQAAIKRAADLMREGYGWAIELDTNDCYPSFDGQKVADLLPLPKQVTRSVLLGQYLYLIQFSKSSQPRSSQHPHPPKHTRSEHFIRPFYLSSTTRSKQPIQSCSSGVDEFIFATEFAVARRGLPQGSATSPLVVEMLLAPVLASLPCRYLQPVAVPSRHIPPGRFD
jgi:hypothetical protein